MTAQSEQKTNTFSPAQFSALDVIGISLSTLLFTLVWVGVFSVFLPEKTSMVVTDGLREVTQTEKQKNLTSLEHSLHTAKTYAATSMRQGVTSLLAIVQTGGSATGVTAAFTQSVSKNADPLARVFPDPAVLGAQTSSLVVKSQVPETLLQQSYVYLNTVTFGLLGRIDKELDMAMMSQSSV